MYIPDPIELMEMRAERMMEEHFSENRPGMFLCAECEQWKKQDDGMSSASPNPSSSPICGECLDVVLRT